MKHTVLRYCAYFMAALAVLVGIAGFGATILLGLSMTALTAKVAVVLAGFIVTAIFVIILMAVSQLWLLFIRMEEDLAGLAATLKSKTGD
jgi:hypothetical protein